MAIDALVKPLLGVELFRGLRPLQVTEIARRAFRTVYKPGEVIIAAGSEGDAAVLIVSGEAERVEGPEGPMSQTLPLGTLLGEMAMLIETEHTSTVVARSTVRALRIARSEMQEQMADDSQLADHFVTRIAERLSRIAGELRQIDGALGESDGVLAGAMQAVAPAVGPAAPLLH